METTITLTPDFAAIETWIFDLDNTLYPAACDLFAEIEVRMGLFITQLLGVDREAAHALRQRYYREHGTTLAGLMTLHGVNPRSFLSFVHEVDLSVVAPNPTLSALIAALPGRKAVFTNGSLAYAERVLARLGIDHHFAAIFDIEAAAYVPKPAPATLDALLAKLDAAPHRAVMFDDIAANLAPAFARGLTTVWIRTARDYSPGAPAAPPAHIHHVTDDLTRFLGETVFAPEAPPS